MARSQDVAALVGKMPEPDKHGKLDGIPWPEAEKVYDEILQGGRENVAKLVGLLKEVDDGEDYKARYVIHGLALHVCRPEKKAQREAFTTALVSLLGGDRPKSVQGFVIREIQVAGGKEAAGPLGKLLADDVLYEDAAMALLAIRDGAAEQFRKALPAAKGKPRLAAVQALGILRDAVSVEALKKAAGDADRDIRLAALWGLANIGDAGSADLALKAADGASGWERVEATNVCLLLAERLMAGGGKAGAAKIYRHLKETRSDPSEAYIREAAEKALSAAK